MAIETTDLLVTYRESDQTHYKLSIDDIGNYIDLTYGSYLRTDAAAGDQTVASTGTTTFTGGVDFDNGISVNAGPIVFNSENITSSDQGVGVLLTTTLTKDVRDIVGCKSALNFADKDVTRSAIDFEGGKNSNLLSNGGSIQNRIGFIVNSSISNGLDNANIYGFKANVAEQTNGKAYNFHAYGTAPNFFQGDTYIGGTTTRNTRELWESTLTDEQKEQLAAGTLVVPANVSTPGDGEFARQWWYDQQDEETQALIDAGELDYPKHFAAATFTNTFALGENTKINLLSDGDALFRAGSGNISIEGGANSLEKVIKFNRGGITAVNNPFFTVTATNTAADGSKTVDPTYEITYSGRQSFYNGSVDLRAITGSHDQATSSPNFLFRFNEDTQAGIDSTGTLFKLLDNVPTVDSGGNSVTDLVGIRVIGKIPTNVANDSFAGFRSSGEVEDGQTIAEFRSFDANGALISKNSNIGIAKAFSATGYEDRAAISYGYYSSIGIGADSTKEKYNFYAAAAAPNYFNGPVTGGGTDGATPQWTIAPNGTTTGLIIDGGIYAS